MVDDGDAGRETGTTDRLERVREIGSDVSPGLALVRGVGNPRDRGEAAVDVDEAEVGVQESEGDGDGSVDGT